MPFTAELEIEGKSYKVYECEYSFSQQVDLQGKPNPKVKGGTIKMVIEGSDDDVHLSWTVNKARKDEGTITFYKIDQSKFREIKFEQAHCIRYKETVSIVKNATPAYRQEIVLTAGKMTVAGIKHNNHWPE
jgi:hypothetical protein